jgi:hypothetical protein|nr:MAG TPA: Protein of unknown function (DUF806) [Caudoviricetes sp.]
MEKKLVEIMEQTGYPVYLQGSLLKEEPYPESFFTYWNDTSDGDSFYDDDERSIVWEFSVNFYSTNPLLIQTQLDAVKDLLKKEGFVVSGKGHSLASDKKTHTGRGIDVSYKEV